MGLKKSIPKDVDVHPLLSDLACPKNCYISSFMNLTLKGMVSGCTRCLNSPWNYCAMHVNKTNTTCPGTFVYDDAIPVCLT